LTRLALAADVSGHYGDGTATLLVRLPPEPPDQLEPVTRLVTGSDRLRQKTFLFGPEYKLIRRDRFSVNARALAGVAHWERFCVTFGRRTGCSVQLPSGTNFAASVGGSLEVPVTRGVSWRVIQPELVLTRIGGGFAVEEGTRSVAIPNRTDKALRVSTGIVVRLPFWL
jgi:hypothetical protein